MVAPNLPISLHRAGVVRDWLHKNFGDQMVAATKGTPFDADLLCAIVCQETAVYWLQFKKLDDPAAVLKHCVFDASGDAPGTSRSAFPKNLAAFREKYPKSFADLLVAEANAMRALRGLKPANYLYKGYGIFQYDLQFVKIDRDFFEKKLWYSFDECLERVMTELKAKYAVKKELWAAVKGYNGAGPAAEQYKVNVKAFYEHFVTDPID